MWVDFLLFQDCFYFVFFFGRGFNDFKFIFDINDFGIKEFVYVISQSMIIMIVRKIEIIYWCEECFYFFKQFFKIIIIVIYKVCIKSFCVLCIIRVIWFFFFLKVRKYDVSLVFYQVFFVLCFCFFINVIFMLYQGICGLVVIFLVQIGVCCFVVFNQFF